jgi:signal transduction histidine kinase
MLLAFMRVSSPDQSQVAGMMTGMLDDLKPILNTSLSFARQALKRDDLPEAAEQMATLSVRSLQKAKGLLQELIEVSPAPRPAKPVNVPTILQSVVEMAVGSALASGEQDQFSFKFSTEDNLPSINGDSGALERVFLNLITNAVHAMPEGGKVLARARLHGGAVLVTISDSGIGMDDETIARIFKPFFTTKGEGSTGLGLAIVNEVVKAHGGQVTVRSKLGEGTTFQIALPVKAI